MKAESVTASNKAIRRKIRTRFVIAGLAVLFLAQLLNGFLTVAAIRKTAFDGAATAVRIVGHDWAFRIQNALRFGKPITQMFGLSEMLADIRTDLPFLSGVMVTLPDGTIAAANVSGSLPSSISASVADIVSRQSGKSDLQGIPLSSISIGEESFFVLPVRGREEILAGTLAVIVPESVIAGMTREPVRAAVVTLALTTALGALVLLLGALTLRSDALAPAERRKRAIIPVVALVSAQALSAWQNVEAFRLAYVEAARANVERTVERFGTDLQRLVDKGIRLDRVSGYDAPFSRMIADIPELAGVRLVAVGASADEAAKGGRPSLDRDPSPASAAGTIAVDHPDIFGPDTAASPLLVSSDIRSPDGSASVARLEALLSAEAIARGVRQRVLDAGTVLLTSTLFVIELLVLFGVLMRRAMLRLASGEAAADDRHHLLGRPAAFTLVFAWALPLSFVPLQMDNLMRTPLFGLSREVALALPISAEMLCALVTAFVAGVLTDRRGWHLPFLVGSLVCAAGAVAAALAADPLSYIGARATVGLGYGLAWMGIQGYVLKWSAPQVRTQAIATLVAGIFAGQICGSATGAMLANQFGFRAVFLIAGVAGLVPLVFAPAFMRAYFGRPHDAPAEAVEVAETRAAEAAASAPASSAGIGGLLKDRNFMALLLLSVVPFSIAQVGLLYYTLPVYLSEQGIEQANIGRIMMLYGLSVIYIAPVLGRWVDSHARKKPFIVLGGLIGGVGLALTFLDGGIATLVGSVVLLGVASSLGGPAQSSFALRLSSVQKAGTGRAIGLQRAADKLGQMLGPIAVGAMFTVLGTRDALGLTGLYYIASTLLFLVIARDRLATRHRTLANA